MRRIIVAGSRSFDDYFTLRRILYGHLCGRGDVTIISGHSLGVDRMVEAYAQRMGIPCEVYPADWKKYGKRAGMVRNAEMAEVADELVAMGLDIPVLTQVFLKLREMGLDVENVYTMEQAVASLKRLKGGEGNA